MLSGQQSKPPPAAPIEELALAPIHCRRCHWPIAHVAVVKGQTVVVVGNVAMRDGDITCPKCHAVREFKTERIPSRQPVARRKGSC